MSCISLKNSNACPGFGDYSVSSGASFGDLSAFDNFINKAVSPESAATQFSTYGCEVKNADALRYQSGFACSQAVFGSWEACGSQLPFGRKVKRQNAPFYFNKNMLCQSSCMDARNSAWALFQNRDICTFNPTDEQFRTRNSYLTNFEELCVNLVDSGTCVKGTNKERGFCGFTTLDAGKAYCANSWTANDPCCSKLGEVDDNGSNQNPDPSKPNNNPGSNGDNKGLSTGARVGIVLGALAFAILLGLLIWCCIRRKKKDSEYDSDKNGRMVATDAEGRPIDADGAVLESHSGAKGASAVAAGGAMVVANRSRDDGFNSNSHAQSRSLPLVVDGDGEVYNTNEGVDDQQPTSPSLLAALPPNADREELRRNSKFWGTALIVNRFKHAMDGVNRRYGSIKSDRSTSSFGTTIQRSVPGMSTGIINSNNNHQQMSAIGSRGAGAGSSFGNAASAAALAAGTRGSATAATLETPEYVMVVHTYMPTLADELPLEVGDKVLVFKRFDDQWAIGQKVSTGQEGAFPLVCTQPQLESSSTAITASAIPPTVVMESSSSSSSSASHQRTVMTKTLDEIKSSSKSSNESQNSITQEESEVIFEKVHVKEIKTVKETTASSSS